jgi:uncharacterized protein (TIGR02996 family)
MHDEDCFLAVIRTTPADDTTRLVYADWLDEHDDPICKTKAAFIRLEIRMAEAPEQNLNRVQMVRELETLAEQIDPGWLATVSHPKLDACRMQFEFECPARWDRLKPTDDPKTRFCDTCKKNVHYCDTLQEAQAHAANGHCVALTVVLARRACLARRPQPGKPRDVGLARGARPPSPPTMSPPPGPGSRIPHSVQPPQPIRLTPDQIERVGRPSVAREPEMPEPVPVSTVEPEQAERRAGERPKWKQERKKSRRRNRNIQRENQEEAE